MQANFLEREGDDMKNSFVRNKKKNQEFGTKYRGREGLRILNIKENE